MQLIICNNLCCYHACLVDATHIHCDSLWVRASDGVCREGVFDALMQELRSPDESDVLHNLDAGELARSMFDLGTKPEMRSRNRQALYSISSAMERAKAKRQRTQQEQGHAAPSKPEAAAAAAGALAVATETGLKAAAALSNVAALSGGAAAGGKKRKAAQMQLDGAAADVAGPSGQDGQATMAPAKPSKATAAAGVGAASEKAAAPAEAGPSHTAGHDLTAGVQGSTSTGKKKGKLLAAKQVPQASAREAGQQGQGQGQGRPQAVAVLKPQQPPKSALKGAKATGADAQATGGKKRDANIAFAFAPGMASAGSTPQMASKAEGGSGSGQKGLSNAGAKTAPPAGAASASAKKSVQINLRKNLYHEFGGPVPPAEVRTPQTARSKVRRCLAALGGGVHVRGGCATVP